ncbi:hypothetical protein AB0B94_30880 [Micromonospora sp. NPDC048986]|uniref:hypothetical protein n=1 Tax=Micromonospora sp. NPDC048986 TaxID=3155644 RepID=UPI0033EF3335
MADLNMTPTRVALLRGVAAGQVDHHRTWDVKKPDYDVWKWMPGAQRRVTTDIAKLRAAKLIEVGPAKGPSMYASQPWRLTDAGRQVLADLDATANAGK